MNMPDNFNTPSTRSPLPARRTLLRNAIGRLLAQGQDGGPPDLEEMWRDFTRKLGAFFGVSKKGGEPGSGGGGFQPDVKSAGIGALLIGAIIVIVWLFSGSFIVQEGQQAVVTTFGQYSRTVDAGWGWHAPYPFQAEETVSVSQLQTAEIGGSSIGEKTGLRDSAMLTQDENIVDVRFNVQYRIKDLREYLFKNNGPTAAVRQAAESAVREIVGRSRIDAVLYEQRDALPSSLAASIQAQLDRLSAGILIVNVNVENVGVPEQVTAAFNEAVKAGADRDRFMNDGKAYASNVVPTAQGAAARLVADAEGYKARIVGAAEGDADRFRAVLAEYQKAPAVTRDRMYIDAMQDIYANVTKVMVDTHGNNNLISLPLDKIAQAVAANAPQAVTTTAPANPAVVADPGTGTLDPRSRDNARSRDRDGR